MTNLPIIDPALLEDLRTAPPDEPIEVVARLRRGEEVPPELRVVARFDSPTDSIVTARIQPRHVARVRIDEAVTSLKAGRQVFGPPELPGADSAFASPAADSAPSPRRPTEDPATGCGSAIGVADWGADIAHWDFRRPDGSTRFLAIWDQRGTDSARDPSVGRNKYGYGRIHDAAAIDAALLTEDPYAALDLHPGDSSPEGGSHGCHVLSIAAGTPGPGRPGGFAPDADLIFVWLADHSRAEGANLGSAITMLEAVDFIITVAGTRPLVISSSVGRHDDAHFGLSLYERALDAAALSHPALAECHSAGNYADAHVHASFQVSAGESRDIRWDVDPSAAGGPHEVNIWYPWRDTLDVELIDPAGATVARVPLADRRVVTRAGQTVARVYHRLRDPNVPRNQVAIYVYDTAPSGVWTIRLRGVDIVDGRGDLWCERTASPASQSRFLPEDADPAVTTGSVANGFHTITVGAYNAHSPRRPITHFSSHGPTADGRPKPELVAPGEAIVGACSAPLVGPTDHSAQIVKSGTSMAAPYVAGLVACLHEAAGRPLPIATVRALLLTTAEEVPPGDDSRSVVRAGYVDPERALKAARAHREPAPPERPPRTTTPPQEMIMNIPITSSLSSDPRTTAEATGELSGDHATGLWTVTDSQAITREGPPAFHARGNETLAPFTMVRVQETVGRFAHVSSTEGNDLGWTTRTNIRFFYSAQPPDFLTTLLANPTPPYIHAEWGARRKALARTYGRLGGLITPLAADLHLDPAAILAVWQVESGGREHTAGQAVIRLENHLLWRSWGHTDPDQFDNHFRFGTRAPNNDPNRCGQPFRCHEYRPGQIQDWAPSHRSQTDEYAALTVATTLAGDELALACISIGGPQILISAHARLGYATARAMFDAFQASERAHVLGFVDFCAADESRLLQALRNHDWATFARGYNGPGQVRDYSHALEVAYADAAALLAEPRTPATERNPDSDTNEHLPPVVASADCEKVAESRPLISHRLGGDLDDLALLAWELSRSIGPRWADLPNLDSLKLPSGAEAAIVAAPTRSPTGELRSGDLLVRRVAGESVPRISVIADPEQLDAEQAREHKCRESLRRGMYASVIPAETPYGNSEPMLRRVLDDRGRVPYNQAIVRPSTEHAATETAAATTDRLRAPVSVATIGAFGNDTFGGESVAVTISPFPTNPPSLNLVSNAAPAVFNAALDGALSALAGQNICAAVVDLHPSAVAVATADGLYQGFHDDDMVYVGSLQKISAMYAAFELRSRVRQHLALALAAGALPTESNWQQIQGDLKAAWQPTLDAAFPHPLPSGFPDLNEIFTFHADPIPHVDFSSSRKSQDELDNSSSLGGLKFLDWLNRALRWSDNHAAARVISALGYPYINGVLHGAGLFDPGATPPNGLWLSGNYGGNNWLPDRTRDDAKAGQPKSPPWATRQRSKTNFAATARQIAHLMTLIALDKLDGSAEMRCLLSGAELGHPPRTRGTGSFVAQALDEATPRRRFKTVRGKIGINDTVGNPPDAGLLHDAAIVERTVGGLTGRYVVVGLCGRPSGVDLFKFFVDVDKAV